MSFFHGVSTQDSANPLNATDIATQINNLFANPNGMVSICGTLQLLHCCQTGAVFCSEGYCKHASSSMRALNIARKYQL